MDDDDGTRAALLTLIRGDDERAQETLTDDSEGICFATLLHGLLSLYDNAARVTRSPLGHIAIGAWLTDIAQTDTRLDRRLAAELILSYNAATSPNDDGDLFVFGADTFNNAIDATDAHHSAAQLLLAVAGLWRLVLPELHTADGLLALQAIEANRR
jgi:hypothetical protein